MNSINFKHRLRGYVTSKPEAYALADCVAGMTERAGAALKIIQLAEDAGQLNPEIMFNAVESVLMEIADIQKIVNHFYESQKQVEATDLKEVG